MAERHTYDVELFTAPEGTFVGTIACSVVWFLLGTIAGWLYWAHPLAPSEAVISESSQQGQVPTAARGTRATRSAAAAEKLKHQSDSPPLPQQHPQKCSTQTANDDDGEWTDDSDTDSSSGDEDLEALRLKMVIVIHKCPELTPQLAAVASAGAALGVVEKTWRENAAKEDYHLSGSATGSSDASGAHDGSDTTTSIRNWRWYLWWNQVGVAKVTLKCNTEAELAAIAQAAQNAALPLFAYGPSVLAIGPAPSDVLHPITGALKLFN